MRILRAQTVLLALLAKSFGRQTSFSSDAKPQWTTFDPPIRSVAVIGAGPAGLMAATQLLEANFSVRLFERASSPGGNWLYSNDPPARESYPNTTSRELSPPPRNLPATIYHQEGDDGLSLADRWRLQWRPRAVWYDLHTNTPSATTSLPGVQYPPGAWAVSVHDVQRHVRAYASMHALNVNDHPVSSPHPVASYATSVESIQKCNKTATWTLTLRRLEWLYESNRVKEDFWTEDFDAVVVAVGPHSVPYVPTIPGVGNWSAVLEDGQYSVHHSQSYRYPERYSNKTVLIVGASVSATQIAQAISPFTRRLLASVRDKNYRTPVGSYLLAEFPLNTEIIPEISFFEELDSNTQGIQEGIIHLVNGTSISGVDVVIFATGYRRNTFLPDIIDQTFSNVHWTGHYIHDPTLAYTNTYPWRHGHFQSTAFARVWKGTARLPSQEQMWREYQERKYDFGGFLDFLAQEALSRQYVAWLNSEALELGGKYIEFPSVDLREIHTYWWKAKGAPSAWILTPEDYARFDNLPSKEWPRPSEDMPAKIVSW
ncbi:FAD/NAD-P-binding domain-containing protein, partial [Roridomyces roridus]